MDAAQWPQGIGVVESKGDEITSSRAVSTEKKPRPQKEQALNCPRCNSTNTKFCYYNNYSLSQPRYFCKTCRRYWTEGGSLRNVPVGGGSRKNKRSAPAPNNSSSPPSINNKKPIPADLPTSQNPKIHGAQDLNLAYNPPASSHHDYTTSIISNNQLVAFQQNPNHPAAPTSDNANSHLIPPMEYLKNGRPGLHTFMSMPFPDCNTPSSVYSSGLNLHDFKPTLNFSLDGFENAGYGDLHHGVQETNAKLFFPNLEDLKQVSSNDLIEQNRGQGDHHQPNGYWNGMLGAGGSW